MRKLWKCLLAINLLLIFINGSAFAVTSQFTATEDSFISETNPGSNFGNDTALEADGDDGSGGEKAIVIKWDVSSIPSGATVTSASIILDLFDASSGAYNIIRQNTPWMESTVDWTDLSGSALVRGVIPAFSIGQVTIPLNVHGVNLVQGWLDGGFDNNGITIRTAGTTNGIDMDSREAGGKSPILEVTYSSGEPTLESLQAEIDALKALLAGVTRSGNDIFYDGVNVHIRNGLGSTNGDPSDPDNTFTGIVNGLGNLIVGYDEDIFAYNGDGTPAVDKSGSHNVVIGYGHNYTSFGTLVAGRYNQTTAPYSSVSGGTQNTASGFTSSVSAGLLNTASAFYASVSGGFDNTASASRASVNGGHNNTASNDGASVLGGDGNTASGFRASVSGGFGNIANAVGASVLGGGGNTASGAVSSVSGGNGNTASGTQSSVGGGLSRTAPGDNDWVAGSLFENF